MSHDVTVLISLSLELRVIGRMAIEQDISRAPGLSGERLRSPSPASLQKQD
jgi:hypothetical protein